MATAAEVKAIAVAGEFDAIADSVLEDWIERATLRVSATVFGALYGAALAYMAAHLYKRGPGGSAAVLGSGGGAVSSVKARNWAVAFEASSGTSGGDFESALRTTVYGREFLALRAQTPAGHGLFVGLA